MFIRLKRALYGHKKYNMTFFVIIFLLITFTSIGYSALSQNLMISGETNYESINPLLYNVLKKEAATGTYAMEFAGNHKDSYTESGTEKIYHWYAADYNKARTIGTKNNVIFAGYCWKLIRTTDTGGVKLMYNGTPRDNGCPSSRYGDNLYFVTPAQNIVGSYWYGTNYNYNANDANARFQLADNVERISNLNDLHGKYTCKSTTSTTCDTLYLVEEPTSGSFVYALGMRQSTSYNQNTSIGSIVFDNNPRSLSAVGYMHGKEYSFSTLTLQTESMLNNTSLSTSYWYADSISLSGPYYSLISPYQVSSEEDYINLVGKYTFMYTSKSYSNSTVYYIAAVNGSTMYYIPLYNGNTLDYYNYTYTYGDSYTDNLDGTYTINNPTTIYRENWYTNYSNLTNKYICKNATNNTCNEPWDVRITGIANCSYMKVGNYKYAKGFTYQNGVYTLNNQAVYLWNYTDTTTQTSINNAHYTCFNTTGECTTLNYVYQIDENTLYYIQLKNGDSVEDALDEMLHTNTSSSTIKFGIDKWYERALVGYENYLDDTIFCNDRTVSSLGGWDSDGGDVTEELKFEQYILSNNLTCANVKDQFSVSNNSAKLTYPVGLLSAQEANLLGYSNYGVVSGLGSFTLTPYKFYHNLPQVYGFGESPFAKDIVDDIDPPGVYPIISLKAGARYISGNGTEASPYIVGAPSNYEISNETSVVVGGGETIYGGTAASINCVAPFLGTGYRPYYSFGYADIDGGTPGNWTTASATATYSVAADFIGNRWYSCRVYGTDGTNTTDTFTSSVNDNVEVSINNATLTFNATTNGGILSGTDTLYVRKGESSVYTTIQGSNIGTIPTASKGADYIFLGWYTAASGGNKVLNADGSFTGTAVSGYTTASAWAAIADKTLYAQYQLATPDVPTISGGETKVYYSHSTTLTCATSSVYSENVSLYYSFGYATSDGGTPRNWSTASTTATKTISSTEYIAQRWYSCRVYARDGNQKTSTIVSSLNDDAEVTINNATITFDATTNGGTLNGTSPLYAKKNSSYIYTTIRGTTTGTIPTASKIGHVFNGWYTAPTGGSKVLNANGTFTGTAVSGYTTASAWNTIEDKTLYAQFSPNTCTINYAMNGGVKGSSGPTSGIYDTNVEVTKPTKTFTVNIDANSQGASITNGGVAVTEVTGAQTFAGWTGTNINTSTAKYGSSSSTVTTSWSDGTTAVGASNATTYFKNLIGSPGTVTLTANWTTGNITLPKVEKTGYECSFNTSSDGSGISYASEGTYTPSTTSGSDTLYVRCESKMLMQHNNTTSTTFGKSISRDSFESITTLNSKTVPGTAIDSWDVSSEQNGSVMAWYLDEDNDSKYELYIGQDGGVKANTDSSYAFYYFRNLDSIDLTYFDTSNVTNMQDMFSSTGQNSTVFTLDLVDNFDTSNVTDMSWMFNYTGSSSTVFTLDLGDNFDTSNVTNMSYMFRLTGQNSTVFTLDLGDKFDTSSVTNMNGMFSSTGYSNTSFTLDLGNKFDTSSVTSMNGMFSSTGQNSTVFTLDLGDKFDTSSVTDMSYMFNQTGYNSTVFTLDLGDKFDTSNVTNMSSMFYNTGYANTTFEIDITQFDFSNVTSYSNIFRGWRTTNTIWVKDASDQSWIITNSGNSNLTVANVLYPFNYTIGYTMNGGVKTSGETSIANGSIITVGKPTKTFTVNIDANSQGASITSGGVAVTEVTGTQTFDGWTGSNLNTSTAVYGTTTDPTTSWNGTTKVGVSNDPIYFKNLRSEAGTVTLVANWTAVAVALPKIEKTGYTCGYATSASGSIVYQSEGSYTPSTTAGSATLYARCTINDPATPTISGGATKIYNYQATTLTCATTSTYATGVSVYYSFGYATSDGGTPGNWTTATTTATLSISATEYVGQRWYSCRVYASDGTNTSGTVAATTTTTMALVNARLYFDAATNGGTVGTANLYVPYGQTNIYTGRTNTTAGTIPSATKDGYTFSGWYTAASGGTQVINASGTVQASVSGWTNASKQWLRTATGNNDTSNVLYAQYVEPCAAFSSDSWATIVSNVQGGSYSRYPVGCERSIDLGTLGTHTIRVANNSNYGCSLSSKTACGFVLEFSDIIVQREMYSTTTGGWPATSMRTYVNSTVYNAIPSALKSGIIDTTVISGNEKKNQTNYTTTDKMYLLTSYEIFGAAENGDLVTSDHTRQLDYYISVDPANNNDEIIKVFGSDCAGGSGSECASWWLRCPKATTSGANTWLYINEMGWTLGTYPTITYLGVSPAFRLKG